MLRYDKQSTTQSVKIFFIKSGILWLLLASISPFYTNSAQNYYKKRTYASKMSFFSKNGRKTEYGKVKRERENGKPTPMNIAVATKWFRVVVSAKISPTDRAQQCHRCATVVAKWSRSPKKTCNTEFANM
jgi:hypothetical protein